MIRRMLVILTAIMMTVPALASAATYWSIQKSASPTTAIAEIVAASDPELAALPGAPVNPAHTVVGSYFNVNVTGEGTTDFYFKVAHSGGLTVNYVKVDGAIATAVLPNIYKVSKKTFTNHKIQVVYASGFTITTSKTGFGYISPSIVGIPADGTQDRTIDITPNSGYAIGDVTVDGASVGAVSSYTFTDIAANHSINAAFALVEQTSAAIRSLPATVAYNTDLTVDGSASTANVPITGYAWSVAPAGATITPSADPKLATFNASATGTYTITLVLTPSTGAGSTATATVTAIGLSALQSQECLNCHTIKDPLISSAFTASVHYTQGTGNDTSCAGCHSAGAPDTHPLNGSSKAALNECATCHSGASSEFYGSVHWQNNFEYGPEFAHQRNVTVAGATVTWDGTYTDGYLNANDSYETLEEGNVVTCAYRCHFRPGMGPDPTKTGNATGTTNGVTYTRLSTGDSCAACHDTHQPETAIARNTCYVCHSGKTTSHGWVVDQFENSTHNTGEHAKLYYQMDQKACIVCHNSHSTHATFGEGTAEGCQTCHQPGSSYSIYDATFAMVAPHGGGAVSVQAQYMFAGQTCANCHINHNNNYNIEYAESGHGNVNGEAWMHYDWLSSSRLACARCHSTTGFVNDVNGVATTANPGMAGEVLACNACHADSGKKSNALRAPGAFTLTASNGATYAYPDAKASNLCVRCHGARETGDSIKLSIADFSNVSFINSHYLAAAGTLYNGAGYEFANQSYNDLGYHKNIGVANVFNTSSTKGACVGCHMESGLTGHSWEVVAKDEATGVITDVTSTTCGSCHGDLIATNLEVAKGNYETALEALNSALAVKGILFANAHPYFYSDLNGNGIMDVETEQLSTNAFKNWESVYAGKGKDVMGAAFNYNLLEHEPGAYAHNKQYALKLIKDSCDFLADGFVDGLGIPTAVTDAISSNPLNDPTSQWSTGAHGTASGHTTGTCQRCHATEGSIVGAAVGWTGSYATLTGSQAAIWTPLTSAVPPLTSTNGISCAACHDPQTFLRSTNTYIDGAVVPWDPNANGASNDQFDLCTGCHTLYDNTGALVGNYHDGGSINVTRTISDSHYDNPATGVGLTSNVVEGYVLRTASASPCADCHNTHMADLAIQEAWATSAHAGKIATKKEEAACAQSLIWFNTTYPTNTATACTDTMTVGTSTRTVLEFFQRNAAGIAFYKTTGALDDLDGNGWTHYNWDQTSSRGSCQRCHTATGAMNFLNSPATYVAAGTGNDFSHLSGWTVAAGSPQQELLYCWGCHSDAGSGALRNPGAITEVYAAATAGSPTATISYPDLGASNVCMGCHLGREIGQNVKNDLDADGVRSFINSHYLAAGGMVFNAAGYEFDSQSYDSAGYHKNVGQDNAYGTGTAGPCVTCHMSSAEAHSFEVSAASTACGQCHGSLTDAILEESKHEFHLALEELKTALYAKGIEFKPAHPYFYQVGTTTAFTNWAGVYGLASWKDVMGAAFNYNLIEHDPGAYAHNRAYALKLIADSIDFLADGAIDGIGTSGVVANAIASKEFAEATSHTATTTNEPSAVNCGVCHAQAPHYGGSFGGNAQYTGNNASCSDCHASGNTTANSAILAQYNESGHGDVEGPAWKTSGSHDWPNAAGCKDCHSTTGYIAKLGGTARSTVVAGAGQTLACDACHTDLAVDGAIRPAGQVTVVYKSQTLDPATATWTLASATFPNATQSNLCINCHAGRESGESIKALTDASMINVSFKNPHYIGAAGMMYAKLGYNFAGQDDLVPGTTTTYGKSLTANEDGGALTSTHRKLGTAAINGDSHNPAIFVPGFQDSDGPCVTCHMADAENHTWEINAQSFTNVCFNCHDDEAGVPLTVDNYKELFIEEQAVPFHDAIELAVAKLAAYNISYSDSYPYFFDNNLVPAGAVRDWTRGGTLSAAEAKQLMGACLNIKLMKAEPAAYVHSRTYARRLLYDTIDWLDNKVLDLSTGATALASDPVKYGKGVDANTAPTTESTKYLVKYSRTTGAWDTLSERP